MTEPPDIILCIPGLWPTRTDLVQAIARDSGGYLFAGFALHKMDAQQFFILHIEERQPGLANAFRFASQGTIDQETLANIDNNTHTLYLICPGGTPEAARNAMQAAGALLQAGGLAVKIETSGKAHSPSNWFALTDHPEHNALYEAFVILAGSEAEKFHFTCGMHNLGLRDAVVPGSSLLNDTIPLMYNFLLYTLKTDREINTGHTFHIEGEPFKYRVSKAPCTHFPEDHDFHNPYGMWLIEILPDQRP